MLHTGRFWVFGNTGRGDGNNGLHTNPSPHLTSAFAFHSHAREASGTEGSPSKSLDSGELLSQRQGAMSSLEPLNSRTNESAYSESEGLYLLVKFLSSQFFSSKSKFFIKKCCCLLLLYNSK